MNLDAFKNWLILNCDEESTVKTYYKQMERFFSYVQEPLTQEKIDAYFVYLIKTKKSKATFNLILSSLRKYLEFNKQSFELPKQRSVDKRINKYITQEKLEKDVISYLSLICPQKYLKVEIILKVLFLTGIRKKELITLKRSNIDLVKCEIELINTKGNVDRIVFFDMILSKQINEFFINNEENNNAFNTNIKEIEYIFKKINEGLNLETPLTPRLCRHSSAVHLIRQGLDVTYVQKILGHKDLETTMIYAEPDFKLVKEAYKNKIKGF